MVKHIRPISLLFCVIALIWLLPVLVPSKGLAFSDVDIVLHTRSGEHVLPLQFAQTSKQRQRGLMYRTELAPYEGMLFDFQEERPITMWMKNTPLALDMIFFNRHRQVVHMHHDAVPYSLDVIDSQHLTKYVLELQAGGIMQYQIQPGDRFEWRD